MEQRDSDRLMETGEMTLDSYISSYLAHGVLFTSTPLSQKTVTF